MEPSSPTKKRLFAKTSMAGSICVMCVHSFAVNPMPSAMGWNTLLMFTVYSLRLHQVMIPQWPPVINCHSTSLKRSYIPPWQPARPTPETTASMTEVTCSHAVPIVHSGIIRWRDFSFSKSKMRSECSDLIKSYSSSTFFKYELPAPGSSDRATHPIL